MGAANSLRNGNNAQLFIMAADASGMLSKIYASDHQSRFINNCRPGRKKKELKIVFLNRHVSSCART